MLYINCIRHSTSFSDIQYCVIFIFRFSNNMLLVYYKIKRSYTHIHTSIYYRTQKKEKLDEQNIIQAYTYKL